MFLYVFYMCFYVIYRLLYCRLKEVCFKISAPSDGLVEALSESLGVIHRLPGSLRNGFNLASM